MDGRYGMDEEDENRYQVHVDNDPPFNNPFHGANDRNGPQPHNLNNRRPMREFMNHIDPAQRFRYVTHGGTNPDHKPTLIHLLGQNQFGGALNEDPHQYLAMFEEHCGTFALRGPQLDALKLNCFHISLRDEARTWLRLLNPRVTETWPEVQKLFLGKYFPPSKTQHFRAKITTFKQGDDETLSEAWDRWQELLRMCPNHGIDVWLLFQFFYAGCTYVTKSQLNAVAGGNLANKDAIEAMEMIENMAISQHEWTAGRDTRRSNVPAGMIKVDEVTALQAKVESLQNQMKKMQQVKYVVKSSPCGICGETDHDTTGCQFY